MLCCGSQLAVESRRVEVCDPVADEVQSAHAAGMCHSDYHLTTRCPLTLPALGVRRPGVITKVGKNVTDLAEGDHVILAFIPACGNASRV